MAKRKKKAKRGGGFGGGEHRPRLHIRGRTFKLGTHSPYKGSSWAINPYMREVSMLSRNPRRRGRRRYRGNPMGGGMVGAVTNTFKHPMESVMDGLSGVLAMYMTIAIPNWILPFPGVDLMSKLIRTGTRVAAGGLLVGFFGRYSPAIRTGASIGAVGGAVLDFFGTRVIVGQGDVAQTPLALLAPLTGTVAAYTRPMLPSGRGLNAYTGPLTAASRGLAARPDFPARAIAGHKLF